jgi:tetratricopeptide (TPR) repeat protein
MPVCFLARAALRGLVLSALCLLSASPAAPDAGAPPPDLPGLLTEAHALFHEAANTDAPEEARLLYRQALDRFLAVASEGRVRNGGLFYDIGNAYFSLGDIGRAVLYYRRAELLIPADRNLRHNLEFARSQRLDSLPPAEAPQAVRVILFWHYLLAPAVKLWLFVGAFAAACIAGALRALRAERWRTVFVAAAGGAALLLLVSLAAGEIGLRSSRDGVITANEVVVRKGDGTAYTPSFVDALHAGAEFGVQEERAGWYRIGLTDGRTGWIPALAAEMVAQD